MSLKVFEFLLRHKLFNKEVMKYSNIAINCREVFYVFKFKERILCMLHSIFFNKT